MEAGIQAVLQAGSAAEVPDWLDDRGRSMQRFAEIARDLGFSLGDDGELPQALLSVRLYLLPRFQLAS